MSFCRKPNLYDYANNEIAILRDIFIYHTNQAMTNAEQIKTVKKNFINVSSAEFTQRVVKVKEEHLMIIQG